jgi:hypothetical protein
MVVENGIFDDDDDESHLPPLLEIEKSKSVVDLKGNPKRLLRQLSEGDFKVADSPMSKKIRGLNDE